MYSHLGNTMDFPDAISGPPSCLCSQEEECEVTADNQIDLVPNIFQEEQCRELCDNNQECNFYTWYDDSALVFGNVCVLLSSCSERDSACSSCHSAPVPCSHLFGSTTPTTPNTTTTTTTTPSTSTTPKTTSTTTTITTTTTTTT